MIKNIIFDLGNVIINYNQKKIINNFTEKEEEIKYIYDEIFHAPEWTLMDLGDITNDEFFSLCTGIVISAHEHVKKPDEKVYRLLLDRYNLNAEECLFIDDDDSGKNYETANKIGIKGRRIMPNQVEEVKKLLLEFNVEI